MLITKLRTVDPKNNFRPYLCVSEQLLVHIIFEIPIHYIKTECEMKRDQFLEFVLMK